MPICALTILVSAFLLFQVEPVIGKIILPWYGGSAAVWTACLVFFQVALLAGYLYAHALVRYVKPRAQAAIHVALLVLSLLTLAVYPSASCNRTVSGDPTWSILLLLGRTIGLPFFLLATTGPLVQAWYARRFAGSMPYWLYALSNAGSMFALLSYPFLFEPVFTTHEQARMWSWGYLAFAVVCAAAALGSPALREAAPEEGGAAKPSRRQYALWLALPACASALLLAVTNHMSQNVAAVPFLWITAAQPLSAEFHPVLRRRRLVPAQSVSAIAGGGAGVDGVCGWPTWATCPSGRWWFCFRSGCSPARMVCHGELALLKPQPTAADSFLPDDRGRRRAGRPGGRLGGAARIQRLL